MEQQKDLKNKFERNAKALSLKPSMGFGKGISSIRITSGLACEIQEGPWVLKTDMPEPIGGNGSAPTPGILGRAAFGSCLATGYMLWASKLDITIDSLEIIVEADYDDGSLLGVSDNPPGYSEVRYLVKIKSPNSTEDIESFLTKAEKHSPYLDVFSRAQTCKRTLKLIKE